MLKPEAGREANQWWQSLAIAAKAMIVGTAVIVIAALAVWVHAAYDTTSAADLTASPPANDRGPYSSLTSVFSLPLPGTRRRAEVEITQGLRTALEDFDDITAAQVVIASPLSPSADYPDSPRLSVQLRLSPSAAPTAEWMQNLVTFVLHSVPGLQPVDLLIADSSGRLLFTQGQIAATFAVTPPTTTASSPQHTTVLTPLPWQPVTILIGSCLAAVLLIYGLRRRRPPVTQHSEEPSPALAAQSPTQTQAPLQFLQELNCEQIVALLAGERLEVADLLTHCLADKDISQQVRHSLVLPSTHPAASDRTVRDDVLTSIAAALRTKLSALDQTLGTLSATATTQSASGGDDDD